MKSTTSYSVSTGTLEVNLHVSHWWQFELWGRKTR